MNDGGIHEVSLPPDVPGRLWLCGKHHIAPDVERVLAATGASTVVCLTRREELDGRWPHYVEWLDSESGRRAIWFPIHDFSAPRAADVRPLLDDLAGRLRSGSGVVVHCAAGIGRTGTMAAALLVVLGVPLDEALATVRRSRPMAGPEVGSQLELVTELATSID